MSMRILATMARVYGAERLLDITGAHIDGCLLHGDSGLEFAERLAVGGARVVVPTTTNVGATDLLHPENFSGDAEHARKARRLMELYEQMGCQPVFTCAPYLNHARPAVGEQVAWAESNAIVFVNSVLGARTERYGDFIDACCAITGRAPAVGLHLEENRRGEIVFDLSELDPALLLEDVFFPVIGYLIGQRSQNRVPVLVGLDSQTCEDQLKALGAAAASSGSVALFHAVGVTPEAPTLDAALQGQPALERLVVTPADLRAARDALSTVPLGDGASPAVDVVALGSPHFSMAEFRALIPLLERQPPASLVEFVVCTSRFVAWALAKEGLDQTLEQLGVRVVVDTCVVVTPILRTEAGGLLMTNSGKFAHYTPGNIGFEVAYGSLEDCVSSAHQGRLVRDDERFG